MPTRRRVGWLTVCLLPISGWNFTRAATEVQYSARLHVSSRQQLEQRLHAPFAEGTAHPAGVSNCVQLLDQRGRAAQAKGSERQVQAERSTTAECLVLQELWSAQPARSSHLRDLPWDARVLTLLPPQLAISVSAESESAASAAAGRGQTWRDFDASVTAAAGAKGPDEIVVNGRGFLERLIIWGRGDFNGDGLEDLLVQSLDTLTEGTYRNTRLFVLTRRTADGPLALVRSLL
jgi:hypothetical protein